MMSLLLKARGSVQDLNRQLDEVAKIDSLVEERLKTVRMVSIFAGIITGLLFILMCAGVKGSTGLFWLSLLLLLPALVYQAYLNPYDVENRKYDMAREFLDTIGKDIPGKCQTSLEISFHDYQKHGKMIDRSQGFMSPVRSYIYEDPWFSAAGRLHDGNAFRVTIVQYIKRKEKRKRKCTAVSETKSEQVKLNLRLDPSTYPGGEKLPSFLKPGISVAGMKTESISLTGSTLRLVASTSRLRAFSGRFGRREEGNENLVNGKKLAALFIHIYSALQKCR